MARAMHMNATEGHPTADKVLRQAITMAVDNEEYNIAENGGERGTPTVSELIPSHPCGAQNPEQYRAQGTLEDARQLLVDNGYVYDGEHAHEGW